MVAASPEHNPGTNSSSGANQRKRFGIAAAIAVGAAVGIGALGFALVSDSSNGEESATVAESDSAARGGDEVDPALVGRRVRTCEDLEDLVANAEALSAYGRMGRLDWEQASSETTVEEVARCLDRGQVVVLVSGAPGVSGIYSNLIDFFPGQMARGWHDLVVTGMGLAQQDGEHVPWFDHGQCFVGGDGEPFQTKVAATHTEWEETITIDVGISFGGGDPALQLPFMGIVREDLTRDPPVTHFYEPALPDGNAVINVSSQRFGGRENPWAGYAVFQTTTYNNREYYPYLNGFYDTENSKRWKGPAETMTVTVLCG